MGKSKVICPICNKEFERATAKKKYCGPECQRLANIKHTREKQKMRHPPDRKASADFHRPAYHTNNMIRIRGQQLEHITVEEYLAKKYNIKEADAGGAETGRK